ncbi:glycoside hydrolase family 35 protein [Phycomyces blakesleeanus]
MSDMTPIYSFFAILPLLLSAFVLFCHQRTHGTLNITTESVAYDRALYNTTLDWNKHTLIVDGEETMILSGEFHYWRVPDRSRWEPILKQYKSAGLNTIRIYFHWGYHSPDENIYRFDGNRDIDHLLGLCERLKLFVLAAPGPYICAETQAGGYPAWLIAKRELNIRHNAMMLWRTYDPMFAAYEVQWLQALLPIIARHQVTTNPRGCVLAVQIDNELFEKMAGILPVGLRDQMRVLAKASRDAGTTVPLFTNDGFEEGGWVPRPENAGKGGWWDSNQFGIDLYGFDKYVVFAPSSSPKSWLIDGDYSLSEWGTWDPKSIEHSIDKLEKTVRGFGGGAKESPMFIPELQGGWFNHYQLKHTYDQIYDFFGDQYTKTLFDSTLAQGVTMANVYMIYGGTNWGALGDPDVYTSYDYSACIREFGKMSMRGRNLRKTLLFAQSFAPYFSKTERVNPSASSSVENTINTQRVAVGADQPVEFTFFRNFDRKQRTTFDVTHSSPSGVFTLECKLAYKTSFIGLGQYTAQNGLRLLLSTLPIHLRMVHPDTNEEIWIVEPNEVGSLAFESSEIQVSGNMQNNILHREGPASILSFTKQTGHTTLTTLKGRLHLIGLLPEQVSTLFADFEAGHWNPDKQRSMPVVAWGADTFYYNHHEKTLEVQYDRSQDTVNVISFKKPTDKRMRALVAPDALPFVHSFVFQEHAHEQFPLPVLVLLEQWKTRAVDFRGMKWHALLTNNNKPVWDSLDYLYTSGHSLYRTNFITPSATRPKVTLEFNARNRATVLVNGRIVGGHTTYSRQLFSPGAKIGPDPWFLGTHTYDLSPYVNRQDNLENEVIVLVDSFGLNRQAFIMNDVRNPRGIINARLNGINSTAVWEITGVDVRLLDQPYNTTGFPDENTEAVWSSTHTKIVAADKKYSFLVKASDGPFWVRTKFDHGLKNAVDSLSVPLRLHLDGTMTANVFLNDVLIGRYYGNGDGPQHDFYIPDGLVHKDGNELKMLIYSWEDTEAHVSIEGWPVDPDSGNLVQDGSVEEYMVWKDSILL